MNITLTSKQERFIQTKLQAGKYRSAQEILEIALRLLDEYDRADTAWIEDVREKIDAAISTSDQTSPIDGETFVSEVLERFGASASVQNRSIRPQSIWPNFKNHIFGSKHFPIW